MAARPICAKASDKSGGRSQVVANGQIRIGLSGWRYGGWRGTFYPRKLAQKNELSYIGQTFRTVEINGTFYSTQAPDSFARWKDAVPMTSYLP